MNTWLPVSTLTATFTVSEDEQERWVSNKLRRRTTFDMMMLWLLVYSVKDIFCDCHRIFCDFICLITKGIWLLSFLIMYVNLTVTQYYYYYIWLTSLYYHTVKSTKSFISACNTNNHTDNTFWGHVFSLFLSYFLIL